MRKNVDVYVAAITLFNVNLRGSKCLDYQTSNSKFSRGAVINIFETKQEKMAYLQFAIDSGWPFDDSGYKTMTAYEKICLYKDDGVFTGPIKRFVYKGPWPNPDVI